MSKNSKFSTRNLSISTDLYGFHRLRSHFIRSYHPRRLNFVQSGSYLDSSKLKSLCTHITKERSYRRVTLNIEDASNTQARGFIDLLDALTKHPVDTLVLRDTSCFKNHEKLTHALSRIITRLKRLRNLEIVLPSEIKTDALFNLYVSLANIRLKDLKIHFYKEAQFIPPTIGIQTYSKLISKLNTLRSLACEFKVTGNSIPDSVKALRNMASKLTNIQQFSVTLDEDMELSPFLSTNKNLEHLEVKSLQGLLSGLGFLNLSESLETLSSLTSLAISLDGIDKATEPTAENLALSLSQLQKLKHLSMKVHRPSNSNNIKLQRLFEFLPELETLQSIEIDLSKTNSAKLAFKEIGKGLSLQKNLQSAKLNFEDCGLTDLELSSIADGFSSKQKLKIFHLNLKDNKQVIAGIVEMFRTLKTQTTLESLSMDLSGITQISDQSLKSYLDVITNNQSLKTVALFLNGCRTLSDEWVMKFTDAIKLTSGLRNLILGLNDCLLVTDRSFMRLTKVLSGMKFLEQVGLGVEKCQISNKGVSYLKQMIRELRSLKFLQLQVPGLKKISHEAFIELGDALKYSRSLNRIGLDQYPFTPLKDEPSMVIENCNHSNLWGFH